jgi:hypothetical protein
LLAIGLAPVSGPPRVGVTADWTITVANAQGVPSKDCQVEFDGTMPEHGHGLPTAPRVVPSAEPGRYRVEGVRFSMAGYWQLDVAAKCDSSLARARFDLTLGP